MKINYTNSDNNVFKPNTALVLKFMFNENVSIEQLRLARGVVARAIGASRLILNEKFMGVNASMVETEEEDFLYVFIDKRIDCPDSIWEQFCSQIDGYFLMTNPPWSEFAHLLTPTFQWVLDTESFLKGFGKLDRITPEIPKDLESLKV